MSYEQTNDDQLYIEDGYFTPDGYYAYVAEAQSSVIVEASLSVAAIRITEASATLTVEATVVTTLSNIYGADLFAFSEAQIAVTVDLIRDNNVAATAQFDTATDAGIVFDQQSAIESQVSVDATAERSRATDSAVEAAFSFVCTISHIEGADIIANGFASLAIDVVKTAVAASTQIAEFTETVSASANKLGSGSFAVTAELYASKYFGTGRPRNTGFLGNSVFDSTVKKFGTHSLRANDSATTTATELILRESDLLFPDDDESFVFEGWYYNSTVVVDGNAGWGVGSGRLLSYWWIRPFTNNTIEFTQTNNGTPTQSSFSVSSANNVLLLNQWNHILLVADANDYSIFLNGTRIINTFRAYSGTTYRSQNRFVIRDLSGTSPLDARFDEFSYHIGTTLGYSTTATTISVPTTTRSNDPTYTRFLYHFDNNYLDDISVTEIAAANILTTATVSASITTAVNSAANLVTIANVTATVGVIKPLSADLTASGGVMVVYDKLIRTDAALASTVELSCTATAVIAAESTHAAEFQQVTDFLRIRSSDVVFDSIATALTAIAITTDTVLDVVVNSDITASPVKTTDSTAVIESATGLGTTATRIQQISEILDSQADLQADAVKIADFSAVLELVAGNITVAVKTADYIIECTDFATLSATAQVSSDVQCLMESQTTLAATGDRIRFGDLTLSAESQLSSQAVSQIQAAATLQMFNSVTANIRSLHIDIYEYRIPRESWTYRILSENTEYSITNENRLYTIRR